jgi:hypothetical protein
MNSQIIFFLTPLACTFILFVCGLISVLIVQIKTYKLTNALKDIDYPADNIRGFVLPARNQINNFKNSFGKSMFSFDSYMIISFGKEILEVKDDSVKVSISNLKKSYKLYITFLVLTGLFLVISMLMFLVVGKTL